MTIDNHDYSKVERAPNYSGGGGRKGVQWYARPHEYIPVEDGSGTGLCWCGAECIYVPENMLPELFERAR